MAALQRVIFLEDFSFNGTKYDQADGKPISLEVMPEGRVIEDPATDGGQPFIAMTSAVTRIRVSLRDASRVCGLTMGATGAIKYTPKGQSEVTLTGTFMVTNNGGLRINQGSWSELVWEFIRSA